MKIVQQAINLLVLIASLCILPSAHGAISSLTDDFNRTSLGSNWITLKGSFGIDNQTLFQWSGSPDGGLALNGVPAGNDYDLTMDTFYTDAMAARGFVVRYQDTANYYYGKVGRNGDAAIIKVQGGVKTTLILYDGPWLTQNTWHQIRFKAEGTSLKLYLDGVLKAQVQDSTFNSGKVGIWADSYYVRFDNFSFNVLDTTPLVNPPTVNPIPEFVASNQMTISGTKEANTGIWINGIEVIPLSSSTIWSVAITLSQEGTNSISILAKNSTGIQSTAVNLSTKLDLSPPILVITSPLNGNTVSADGFKVTGTTSDQVSGIEDVRISVTEISRRVGCEREDVTTVNNALTNFDSQTGIWFFDVLSSHISPGRQAFIVVTSRDKLSHSTSKTIQVIVGQFEPITGSVSIANGSAYTKSTAVTLQLTRSTNVVQMSLSQDGITFQTPEAFSDTKSWTLMGVDGVKTVFVKFFNTTGRSSQIYSDSIILDTIPPSTILTSSQVTNQVQYTLTYTVDGTAKQESITLTDGENVINRTFSDLAGNETTTAWRITLDQIIPVITGPSEIYFTPNDDLNQDTAQITGQISESADWKIEISDSTQTVLKSFQGTGMNINISWDGINPLNSRPYPDGVYTAKVTAKDAAINDANPLLITLNLSTHSEIERIYIYAGDKRIAVEETTL